MGNSIVLAPPWRDDHPEHGAPGVHVCRDAYDVELIRKDFEYAHKLAGDRRQYSFHTYRRDVRLGGARFYLYFVLIRYRKPSPKKGTRP